MKTLKSYIKETSTPGNTIGMGNPCADDGEGKGTEPLPKAKSKKKSKKCKNKNKCEEE